MNIKKTILVLCLGALGACSSNPIAIKSDATVLDTEARRMKAIEYGERQWFHQALVEWKILSTIDPDNPEFANRINITESIIKRRVRSLLVHAKKTYKSGDVKHAQEQFLAILALEPSQHEALNYLRNIEETRVKAIQMAKTQRLKEKLNDSAKYDSMEEEMEQQAATEQAKIQVDNRYLELGITAFQNGDWENTIREVNKFISSRGATPRSRQLISQAHLNLSKAAMDQKQLENAVTHFKQADSFNTGTDTRQNQELGQLREKISDELYVLGVRTFRSDVAESIKLWEKAISINPEHANSKRRLKKAYQIQQNLKQIVDSDS